MINQTQTSSPWLEKINKAVEAITTDILAEVEERHEVLSAESARLEKAVRENAGVSERMSKEIAEKELKISELDSKVIEFETMQSVLDKTVDAARTTLENLKTQSEEIVGEVAVKDRELAKKTEELEAVSKNVEKAKALFTDVSDKHETLSRLSIDLEEKLAEQTEIFSQKSDDFAKKYAEMDAVLKDKNGELGVITAEVERKSSEFTGIKQMIEAYSQELNDLNADIEQARASKETVEKEIARMQEEDEIRRAAEKEKVEQDRFFMEKSKSALDEKLMNVKVVTEEITRLLSGLIVDDGVDPATKEKVKTILFAITKI